MPPQTDYMELLTAYLDGELSADLCAEVETLLATDAHARLVLDDLRETSRLIANLPRGRASEDLSARVTARLERQALLGESSDTQTSDPPKRAWSRRLAIAASITLISTAAWLGWPELAGRHRSRQVIQVALNSKVDSIDRSVEPTDEPALKGRRQIDQQVQPQRQFMEQGHIGPAGHETSRSKAIVLEDKAAPLKVADANGSAERQQRVGGARMLAKGGSIPGNTLTEQIARLDSSITRKKDASILLNQEKPKSPVDRVEVFTDTAMVKRLVRHIRNEMDAESIGMKNRNADTESDIAEDQERHPFYSIQYGPTASRRTASEASPTGRQAFGDDKSLRDVRIIIGLHRQQMERLLVSMSKPIEGHENDARWEVNGERVPAIKLAQAVLPSMEMLKSSHNPKHSQRSHQFADEAHDEDADGEEETSIRRTLPLESPTSQRASHPRALKKSFDIQGAETSHMKKKPHSSGGIQDAPLIRLTLTLRAESETPFANLNIQPDDHTADSMEDGKRPSSPEATSSTGSVAASQPTTQNASAKPDLSTPPIRQSQPTSQETSGG